jgi:hypothetical protein
MRQLCTATLAAAVALAFATAAQSATMGTASTGVTTFVAPVPTASPSTSTTRTPTRAPTVTVDVRAQQTAAATALTHASGSTSANEALLSLSDAARTATIPALAPGVTSPGIVLRNGAIVGIPGDATNGGATSDNAAIAMNPIYAASDVTGGASVLDTNVVANQAAQANGASVDRAIRVVASERRRIGRNGQLLNTIAPRTNGVDRSREMPDDPLPPSLTGSNSTLVH